MSEKQKYLVDEIIHKFEKNHLINNNSKNEMKLKTIINIKNSKLINKFSMGNGIVENLNLNKFSKGNFSKIKFYIYSRNKILSAYYAVRMFGRWAINSSAPRGSKPKK